MGQVGEGESRIGGPHARLPLPRLGAGQIGFKARAGDACACDLDKAWTAIAEASINVGHPAIMAVS